MTLDMTVLQSAGMKHDDQLRIEYDPGSADDGLKSAAVTLAEQTISSETVGRFDTISMLIWRICQKSAQRPMTERILF